MSRFFATLYCFCHCLVCGLMHCFCYHLFCFEVQRITRAWTLPCIYSWNIFCVFVSLMKFHRSWDLEWHTLNAFLCCISSCLQWMLCNLKGLYRLWQLKLPAIVLCDNTPWKSTPVVLKQSSLKLRVLSLFVSFAFPGRMCSLSCPGCTLNCNSKWPPPPSSFLFTVLTGPQCFLR